MAEWSIPFANDGGPLIVLPRDLLPFWHGTDGLPVSEDFPFGPDYARACEADYPASLIDVGPAAGLVIGAQDIVFPARWLRLPEGEPVLVGWEYGDDGADTALVERLMGSDLDWACLPGSMALRSGDLVLLHAASSGRDLREPPFPGRDYAVVGDAIPAALDAGEYAIDVAVAEERSGYPAFRCIVCRWRLV
jgi:immunity protein 21 of polymorphic toxin system